MINRLRIRSLRGIPNDVVIILEKFFVAMAGAHGEPRRLPESPSLPLLSRISQSQGFF